MRVMLWNTAQHLNGKLGPEQIKWNAGQDWTVAILLEVTRSGLKRLREAGDERRWEVKGSLDAKPDRTKGYSIAVLARRSAKLGVPIAVPTTQARRGLYEERSFALPVKVGDDRFVVGGFHLPNSQTRKGSNHAYKEEAFEALESWVKGRSKKDRLILGLDVNRGDWERHPKPVKQGQAKAREFLQQLGKLRLQDGFSSLDPSVEKLPHTHWTRRNGTFHGHRGFDRILVSKGLIVDHIEVVEGIAGPNSERLSDHAPLIAEIS